MEQLSSAWVSAHEIKTELDKAFSDRIVPDLEDWGETPEDEQNLQAAMNIAAQADA